eukprot:CAMPEP_0115851672 /NCGR_PEP_ID=MMETSP0287-20121206/12602_1 /TAXON_ID=412157 /ORGANISM="Chrysochromulina rotalis, Strain UIO044" /LENGTH=145 /DNA_ID=CAMNT_0003305711 /DNA_START=292 /DNA_END=727 /DNA_ORIENTATION=-
MVVVWWAEKPTAGKADVITTRREQAARQDRFQDNITWGAAWEERFGELIHKGKNCSAVYGTNSSCSCDSASINSHLHVVVILSNTWATTSPAPKSNAPLPKSLGETTMLLRMAGNDTSTRERGIHARPIRTELGDSASRRLLVWS